MYDKTFALVSFGIVLVQFIVFILPYWKINDKKDLISEGFEAFEGELNLSKISSTYVFKVYGSVAIKQKRIVCLNVI